MSKKVSLKQTQKKIMTRCSKLPLMFSCRNAGTNPERLQEVEVENSASGLGTDIHDVLHRTTETGEVNFRKIEAKYSPEDVERARLLFANGLQLVQEAKRDMRNPQCEIAVSFETEHFVVTGHIDLVDCGSSLAHVVDYKTGRTRDDHYHQMMGYAVGVWTKMGRPEKYEVRVACAYLESNEVTQYAFNVDDMKGWLKELDSLPERYTVNRRCVYCPLQDSCPALRTHLKGSITLLTEVSRLPEVRIRKLDKTNKIKLTMALKMADTAVKRIRGFIKEDAIKNGDIEIGDGNKFIIRTRENRILLPVKALPVLGKYVSAKDISRAMKLSLPDLLDAACKRVKTPMRATIRKELNAALEKAGAVVSHEYVQLETVFDKGTALCRTRKQPKL